MKYPADIRTPPQTLSKGIALTIQGLGHVPSLKNSKSLFKNKKTGATFIATKPSSKKWMEKAIQSLELQLRSFIQTTDGEMEITHIPQLLILWSQQFDDCIEWIPEINIRSRKVEKGSEGAIILIEEIE